MHGYPVGHFAQPDAPQHRHQEDPLKNALLRHHGRRVGQVEGLVQQDQEEDQREQGLVVGLEGEQGLQGERAQGQGISHLLRIIFKWPPVQIYRLLLNS